MDTGIGIKQNLNAFMIAMLATVLTGCQEGRIKMFSANTDAHFEKARKDIQDAATSTTEALASVRTDYCNQTQKKLLELDTQYQQLLLNGRNATGQAKAEILKKAEDLEERRAGIKNRLEEYQKANDKAAESIRTGIEAALAEYSAALGNP